METAEAKLVPAFSSTTTKKKGSGPSLHHGIFFSKQEFYFCDFSKQELGACRMQVGPHASEKWAHA